tara:strand:- start:1845 stop:2639 length:795 start_codon:yes stop_codon:yes gene_type:complete
LKDTYLKKILETTRISVSERKKISPLSKLESRSVDVESTRGFKNSLIKSVEKNNIAVIAEMKKASPSLGLIRKEYEPEELAQHYAKANAACLSVLTDEPFFQGSIEHLTSVRKSVDLPLLRKDFIIDEYQVYESRFQGADCILLIAAALTQNQLKDYYQLAIELKLDVLVEVHAYDEVEKALSINANLIGINNRNLKTFEVDLETTKHLTQYIPQEVLVVSESGIKTREDVQKICSYGVSIFLVGEAFMKADNPGSELKNIFFN